jgi:hypothetical protein
VPPDDDQSHCVCAGLSCSGTAWSANNYAATASPVASIVTLGETQLQIEMAASTTFDTIAVGVLSVDAALAAVVIAAKELFGHLYWQPLIALGCGAVLALVALVGGGSLGWTPQKVYNKCKGMSEEEVDREVIAILDAAVKSLHSQLVRKRITVGLAILVLVSTVVVTTVTVV